MSGGQAQGNLSSSYILHRFILLQLRNRLRALFFLFLAYSGLVYAAGRKKNEKKHTEHERVQFLGTTEHESGALHARHMAKNTH